jgi:hypothetical protein
LFAYASSRLVSSIAIVIVILLLTVSVFALSSLFSSTPLQIHNASGETADGLLQRTFRNVGVSVFAHSSIIFLKDGSSGDGGAVEPPWRIAISLNAYNFTNNQAYSHVTYEVTLTEKSLDHPILKERFYAPSSNTLTLLLVPDNSLDNNKEDVKITGAVRNATLDAFVPENTTTDGKTIIEIKSSIMNQPDYYMINATLVSADGKPYTENDNSTTSSITTNTNNKEQNLPYSTASIVVSDTKGLMVSYHGQFYNVTAISYGMHMSTFDFDNKTSTLKWSIPFDFNAAEAQIEKQKDDEDNNKLLPFIHQEVFIPKPFPYLNTIVPTVTQSSALTVNGHAMSERNMVIDPDTNEKYYIIHVLIPSNDILSLAKLSKAEGGSESMTAAAEEGETATITFAVPLGAVSLPTSTDIPVNYSGMLVRVHWLSSQLGANTNSTANLEFFQSDGQQRISDDVRYNIKVIDKAGDVIYNRENLTAVGGKDQQQSIIFPKNETYRLEIAVTGIVRDGSTLDTRGRGVAEGVVVVPEFPLGVILLPIAAVIGAVIFVGRRWIINTINIKSDGK